MTWSGDPSTSHEQRLSGGSCSEGKRTCPPFLGVERQARARERRARRGKLHSDVPRMGSCVETLCKSGTPFTCCLLWQRWLRSPATDRIFELVGDAADPGLIYSAEAALCVTCSNEHAFAPYWRNNRAACIRW